MKGVRGIELYPSRGLNLEIVLPERYLEADFDEFTLTLHPGCLGDEQQIILNGKSNFCLNLDEIGHEWKPGAARLLAELHRKNSRRALARSSILFWNGLSLQEQGVFYCHQTPENLDLNFCENVSIKGENITYESDMLRFFRLAFEDGGRIHYFTWPVPGIFLSIEDHDQNMPERPITLNSTLTATSHTRNVLKIFASAPAVIELGDFRVKADFNKISCKRIPVAGLLEYITPKNNTLFLKNQNQTEPIPLVKLTSPQNATQFFVKNDEDNCEIKFLVQGEIDGLIISHSGYDKRDIVRDRLCKKRYRDWPSIVRLGFCIRNGDKKN